MAFTRVAKDMGVISALPDKPNDVGGLSAAQLKAKFDEGGAALKTYLNGTLLSELEGSGAAGNIGIEAISGIVATTVQAALEALKAAIDSVSSSGVADNGVTTAKIASSAVTTDKLADNSVTAAKIKDGEVKAAELASNAVETAKIKDGAVTTAKLGAASVTYEKMAAGSVGTDQLKGDLLVPVSKGGTGATNGAAACAALGAQTAIQSNSLSLTVAGWTSNGSGWTQTVTVAGMTTSSAFVCSPADATSWDRAADANVKTPTAGSGTLTFTCDTKPDNAISVTVYFW